MSRLHLGMGIFAYLASPLWLLMLLLSSSLVVDHTLTGDVYFGADPHPLPDLAADPLAGDPRTARS